MENHSSSKLLGAIKQLARRVETICFWGLAASSLAPLCRLDEFRIGMLLTYSPRILWMLIAGILLVNSLVSKRFYRSGLVLFFACLLIWDTPLGSSGRAFVKNTTHEQAEFTLLSFNVGNQVDHAQQLAELCLKRNVDLLSLQEVSPLNRDAFRDALPEYRFFHGDEAIDFEHAEPWVFSSLIGIRKSLLNVGQPVEISTSITGYRTFAIKATLDNGQALRIANVHTTKPVTIYYGVEKFLSNAANKAARHRGEKQQLAQWLESDTDTPTIIAGDFNAPANSYNLRFPNTIHAHRNAGSGLHLTFPRSFPVIGIDHIIASENITFTSCDIVDAGFSDHCAQVSTFFFRQSNLK